VASRKVNEKVTKVCMHDVGTSQQFKIGVHLLC
jgi:hypothetical protein